ncbi:glutathionylspermidine synthase family protein [Bacillus suaedaesalsae]|uniref:Glutathionylspermidine synthase family protein n=1 Tax=Bacillus suaedaesalsae TaxID=2810349 RepID=A0ABS2DKD2_9BACI|nr:glutathionylspermidine synthase family protein [Bacillus suaedaesalsae]MBM6618949.1 glutathionylspermidine synthase family protein [Bacillus suaedaesalsae]
MNLQEHIDKREKFYHQVPEFWADLYGQEYGLYDVHLVDKEFVRQAREFAHKMGQLFFKTASLLRSETIGEETFLEMGYPKETIKFMRQVGISAETVIGRFDSVFVEGTHKLLEFNADTPTFIYELFRMNGRVCEEFGYKDPNVNEEEVLKNTVQQAIKDSYKLLNRSHYPNIVFTSHHDHVEDRNTLLYLMEQSGLRANYVPLHELTIIKGEALLDNEGRPIDVLYRQTFPIESLILDEDHETHEKIGLQLMDLVLKRKLAVVNPPSAFLLQNKAVMSVIWGLHEEQSPFFSEEEHSWIQEHFLPTYLEPDAFLKNKVKFVKKPIFGREGDTVEIFDGSGMKVEEELQKSYTHYLSVYQKYVDLPKTTFKTVKGVTEGHIMVGTFLLNGEASSIGFRVGHQITNNLSYFLPVGMNK